MYVDKLRRVSKEVEIGEELFQFQLEFFMLNKETGCCFIDVAGDGVTLRRENGSKESSTKLSFNLRRYVARVYNNVIGKRYP